MHKAVKWAPGETPEETLQGLGDGPKVLLKPGTPTPETRLLNRAGCRRKGSDGEASSLERAPRTRAAENKR